MPKKGFLGCSFPLLIGILIIVIILVVVGFIVGSIGSSLLGNIGPSWLHVPSPKPELPPEVIFHIGSLPVTNSMLTAWISTVVIVLLSFFAFRRPKVIPSGLQKVMEFVYGSLLNFCEGVAGEKNGRRFFPFVATIFIFVIVNAWMGLLPGYGSIVVNEGGKSVALLRPANTDVNVPLAIALFSFVSIEYFGLRSLGIRYLRKFINTRQFRHGVSSVFHGKLGPGLSGMFYGVIDIFVGVLEGLSEFIRIVSFTFRLFGNMTAGEILLLIVSFLFPFVFSVIFYSLEILVGFVQALIFGGLTLVFMTLAVASHDEEH